MIIGTVCASILLVILVVAVVNRWLGELAIRRDQAANCCEHGRPLIKWCRKCDEADPVVLERGEEIDPKGIEVHPVETPRFNADEVAPLKPITMIDRTNWAKIVKELAETPVKSSDVVDDVERAKAMIMAHTGYLPNPITATEIERRNEEFWERWKERKENPIIVGQIDPTVLKVIDEMGELTPAQMDLLKEMKTEAWQRKYIYGRFPNYQKGPGTSSDEPSKFTEAWKDAAEGVTASREEVVDLKPKPPEVSGNVIRMRVEVSGWCDAPRCYYEIKTSDGWVRAEFDKEDNCWRVVE